METDVDVTDPLAGVNAKTGPSVQRGLFSLRRVKGFGGFEGDWFHVMSRTCGGAVFFDEVEKEALRRVMRRMALFCGVEIATYCVMGNHFHILLRVPQQARFLERFEGTEGEARLLEHLKVLYSKEHIRQLVEQLADWREKGLESEVQRRLWSYKRRMADLAWFMKQLKERFSRWYNKRHERKGTLWMERYKSVLVEGRRERRGDAGASQVDVLRMMACYIDLNPVRAELVTDPAAYRWSGYGEAMGGGAEARAGLCGLMGIGVEEWEKDLGEAASSVGPMAKGCEIYASWMFDVGQEVRTEAGGKGKVVRKGIPAAEVKKKLEAGGKVSVGEMLRLRVRYFTDGMVIGGREFVEEVFEKNRGGFGEKRKSGARKVRGCEDGLYTMRDLKVRGLG
jgi:putative transposase